MNTKSRIDRRLLTTYVNGFMLSIIFTLAAYALVVQHTLSNRILIAAVAILALVQFLVQLVCFLHLGRETKPRWKLVVLIGMITVVLILVAGSIWIMNNLGYHMTPQQINTYMQSQDGL
ncbi:MAG TPA: cytochrome o ubiquinol oxidase subunit IV [Candidatus Saccharimonadales bacterium]|nr:cytochrome o ubiquinol oxidase subunit IV [Candidatus Saccharimonadales bacterium]